MSSPSFGPHSPPPRLTELAKLPKISGLDEAQILNTVPSGRPISTTSQALVDNSPQALTLEQCRAPLLQWIASAINENSWRDGKRRWPTINVGMIEHLKAEVLERAQDEAATPITVAELLHNSRQTILAQQLAGQARLAPNSLPLSVRSSLQSHSQESSHRVVEFFDSLLTPRNFPDATGLAFALTRLAGLAKSLNLDHHCSDLFPLNGQTPRWTARFKESAEFETSSYLRAAWKGRFQGITFSALGLFFATVGTGIIPQPLKIDSPEVQLLFAGLAPFAIMCTLGFRSAASNSQRAKLQILKVTPMDSACLAVERILDTQGR